MALDITSANAVIIFTVPLLLPVPFQLQGFAADNIFDVDEVDATEVMMGLDGGLSGGVIPAPIMQNFSLQADSPSLVNFDAWYQSQRAALAVYTASAIVTFTGIGTSYACVNGLLKRYKPMADAHKTLMPRRFQIAWQNTLPIPVGSAG